MRRAVFRGPLSAALLILSTAALAAQSGGGSDPQQAAERAARDAARAEERATRDASEAQERAARAAADIADRAARIESDFATQQSKIAEDAVRDPSKASEDLAKAEADRQRALSELSTSSSGSSGSSGSGDSSGSGSSGSSGSSSNSGSSDDNSGSNDSSGTSSAMRDLAREESPDFDARGFPVRHGEVVALDLDDASLAVTKAQGFRVIERTRLDTLSGSVTRLDLPPGMAPEAALGRLRAIDRGATFDYTHYYGLQTSPQGSGDAGPPAAMHRRPGNLTIGMIDTGVISHPVLAGTAVTQRRFGAAPSTAKQVLHGTAIASILASEGSRRLWVADVFRGTGRAPYTSADSIARALEWMAQSGIAVVNISLAGPRNAILDRLIERASAHGMVIVAAAGNGGPTAPPAYPAALGSVVAVTAVDAQSHVYRYANRGDYIAVAARGVSESAASPDGTIGRYSGTSFATPHVAAWMARCLTLKGSGTQQCRARLNLAARDVGAPGRDPVYGWGIIDTR